MAQLVMLMVSGSFSGASLMLEVWTSIMGIHRYASWFFVDYIDLEIFIHTKICNLSMFFSSALALHNYTR